MGVYINGMEMPEHCGECAIEWCNRWKKLIIAGMSIAKTRPSDCPLVPVSPHGDLIDRDALIKEMDKQENAMYEHGREFSFSFKSGGDVCTAWYNVEMMVEDAPTIIPAEEGE